MAHPVKERTSSLPFGRHCQDHRLEQDLLILTIDAHRNRAAVAEAGARVKDIALRTCDNRHGQIPLPRYLGQVFAYQLGIAKVLVFGVGDDGV